MPQHFHYTVNMLLQGIEQSKLCFAADSQATADKMMLAAAKEGTLSELIDDCQSSETNLDYESVTFLPPEQANGRETVSVFRDKQCIYSNRLEQKFETFEELLSPALEYLENELSCITCEELKEQAEIAIAQLNKAIKRLQP